MSAPVAVLDASVGVKWFREEAGSEDARALLAEHVSGEVVLAVSSLFLYEVLAVSARDGRVRCVERVWSDLARVELAVVPIGEAVVRSAAAQRETLGCSLYDAFSAGLAHVLDAPLYTADARAHGAFPRVRMIG